MSSAKVPPRHIDLNSGSIPSSIKDFPEDTPHDSPEISPSIYQIITHNRHNDDEDSIELTHTESNNRQFTLFGNQVAGTLPMLHSNGLLYKPLKTDLEHKFYTKILDLLPSIKPFIPRYNGMEYIKIGRDDDSESEVIHPNINNNDETASFNNDWSAQMYKKNHHRIRKMPFLILEDITLKYSKPNILDLKIGTRHFPPRCTDSKKYRKLRKSWCSTCSSFGVRLSGLQIYNNTENTYENMSKNKAMVLKKGAFCDRLSDFFRYTTHSVLHRFINKLCSMQQILKYEHRFRWFSCSLLFVYEGLKDTDTARDEYKTETDVAVGDDEDILDLKIIDFTNFVMIKDYKDEMNKNEQNMDHNHKEKILQLSQGLDNLDCPDHGLLFGLETLIKLLREIKSEGRIKKRNGKQWRVVTENSLYKEKALIPFRNKDCFNENTTI